MAKNMVSWFKFYSTYIVCRIIYFYQYHVKDVLKQLTPRRMYYIIRYGFWDYGYDDWDDKPKFGIYYLYYDGNNLALHIGNFYLSVEY